MQTASRQAYLDWLRIMAIVGVLFFHSAMAYVAEWDWHIKNKETSHLLMEFNFFLHQFRMPLLFFISGTVTYFMLQKRSSGSFIGLRFRRLLVPLIFGMLVIVPPQVYMERLTQGFNRSFADFYPSIFTTGSYPAGNMSWHHLWFIAYLFLYDVLLAGIFKWCTSERGKIKLKWLHELANNQRVYMLMLPGVILYTSFSMRFPETNDLIHDFCYFFYWLFFLLGGFVCINFPSLMDSLEKNRRISLALAIITIVIINYLRWNQLEPYKIIADWQHDWRTYLYRSLYPLTAWSWVFTAIGYGKRYLNKKLKVLDYLNQAVYPFYILHQTVIVIIVYYVVQTTDTIIMKYLFTVVVSFFLTMSIYHVFIRPFAITRFLFGMKPHKNPAKTITIETPVIKGQQEIELAS
jgi:peptidoglycan/LPS O-acetylase OafA/YrhL